MFGGTTIIGSVGACHAVGATVVTGYGRGIVIGGIECKGGGHKTAEDAP